jgi:hypothetical protein
MSPRKLVFDEMKKDPSVPSQTTDEVAADVSFWLNGLRCPPSQPLYNIGSGRSGYVP